MFSRVSVSVMKKQQRTNKRRGEGPGRHRAPTEQPYDHNALHSAVAHRIGKICHHMSNVPHESHKKRTRFYYIFFSCSGIRSQDRPARGSSSSMVSSNIRPTQWRGDVSQNGTERRRRILYCLQAGRDGVSRVLSHSYNARDTHGGTYLLYRRPYALQPVVVGHGPLWPWKTDHRSTAVRRTTCTSRMDGFIKRKALADRFSAR
ncbi:uncharacterized protein [Anoplolepis gracilipes]|uniref:uncharacterized protein isoform X1 n=1 Tax=Anoplolepis gracilipes TaxID=354296 RepID=UPI003BA2D96E